LALIGLDRVVGWFGPDAFAAWTATGRPLSTIARLTTSELASALERNSATVLDVRTAEEVAGRRIAGTEHAPLGHLLERARALPHDRPVVLFCQSGSRSAIGASLLIGEGFTSVANVAGGIDAWEREGRPVERDLPAEVSGG
jgi:hydroxyacylglutathione hydrolase